MVTAHIQLFIQLLLQLRDWTRKSKSPQPSLNYLRVVQFTLLLHDSAATYADTLTEYYWMRSFSKKLARRGVSVNASAMLKDAASIVGELARHDTDAFFVAE